MSVRCMRCLVRGRVQGVWFRAGAREQALKLGIDGYARNLDDGRVEVVAAGTADSLEALRNWLHRGPSAARVDAVDWEWVDETPPPGEFQVR
ncbi:MAG: acylphosphatase [Ectothiorhodospiraceae bacterium]|nr:acylphosphatase [Ectothiorhodospiraceae bacterium]